MSDFIAISSRIRHLRSALSPWHRPYFAL